MRLNFRRRDRLTLVALATSLLASGLVYQSRTVKPEPPAPVLSVWDGARPASLAAADADRFVRLWLDRLKDPAWFAQYVAQEEISAEVAAEGFHALDDGAQMYLTRRLADELGMDEGSGKALEKAALDAPVGKEGLDLLTKLSGKGHLAGASGTDLASRHVDQMRTLLYLLIFEKDLQRNIRQTAEEAKKNLAAEAEAKAAEAKAPPTPPEPTELEKELAALKSAPVTEQVHPDAVTPELRPATTGRVPFSESAGSASRPPRLAEGEVAPVLPARPAAPSGDAPVTFRVDGRSSPGTLPVYTRVQTGAEDDEGPLEELAEAFRSTIDSTTYRICGESDALGANPVCSLDVAMGTPVPVDLTGDGSPDAIAQLAPSFNPSFPLGFSAQYEITRIGSAPAEVKGHVFAVFEVPQAAKRLAVGLDARKSTLSPKTTMTFTLKSLPDALAGTQIGAVFQVADQGPERTAAVTAGFRDLTYGTPPAPDVETDPVRGAFEFKEMPSSFLVDFGFSRLPIGERYTVHVESAKRTVLIADIRPKVTADKLDREILATMDEIPNTLDVVVETSTGGPSTLDYKAGCDDANDPCTAELTFVDTVFPQEDDRTTYKRIDAAVHRLPKEVNIEFNPPLQIGYTSSQAVGTPVAQRAALEANIEFFKAGVQESGLSAALTGLPSSIHVGADIQKESSVRLSYDASDPGAGLAASFLDVTKDNAVGNISVTDIPKHVEILAQTDIAEINTTGPIGEIEGAVSTQGVSSASFPVEFDFVTAKSTSTKGIAVGFRVTSLTGALYDARVPDVITGQFGAAQRRKFGLQYDAPDIFAYGEIHSLPRSARLTMESNRLIYNARDSIGEIKFNGKLFLGRPDELTLDAGLKGLPTDLTVGWETSRSGELTYTADGVVDEVSAHVKRSDFDADATVTHVPRVFDAKWDLDLGAVDFQTKDPNASDNYVGSIGGTLSLNGGTVAKPAGNPDHAVLDLHTDPTLGEVAGASFLITGLKKIQAEPDLHGARYLIELDKAGRPFVGDVRLHLGDADVSDDVVVNAFVSGLPKSVDIHLHPANNTFHYDGDPIEKITGYVEKGGPDGLVADVLLEGLPDEIDATWVTGRSTKFTYSASATFDKISAAVQTARGQDTFSATVTDLPRFVQAELVGKNVKVDARTSATAAPASASVGGIELEYGSNGAYLARKPNADDKLVLKLRDPVPLVSPGLVQAYLLYHGLKSVTLNMADGQISGEVRNSAPRLFRIDADLPDATLISGYVDKVPSTVTVKYGNIDAACRPTPDDSCPSELHYTASSTIDEIFLRLDRPNDEFIEASVRGVPSTVDLDLDLGVSKKVVFRSSDPDPAKASIQGLTAKAKMRLKGRFYELKADVSKGPALTAVPKHWELELPNEKHIIFDSKDGVIGRLEASITNHGVIGTVTGKPRYLYARYIDGTPCTPRPCEDPIGDLDAVLAIEKLDRFEIDLQDPDVIKGGLDILGRQDLYIDADAKLNAADPDDAQKVYEKADRLILTATLSRLPSSITFQYESAEGKDANNDGVFEVQPKKRILYQAPVGQTFDINADVRYGVDAAVTALPSDSRAAQPIGVWLRDASGTTNGKSGTAIRAKALLYGLPHLVDLDLQNSIFKLEGFDPPATISGVTGATNYIEFDGDLKHMIGAGEPEGPTPLIIKATQSGIPSNVNVTVGPFRMANLDHQTGKRDEKGKAKRITFKYVATKQLGTLDGFFQIPTKDDNGADAGELKGHFNIDLIPLELGARIELGLLPHAIYAKVNRTGSAPTIKAGFRYLTGPKATPSSDFAYAELAQLPATAELKVFEKTAGTKKDNCGGEVEGQESNWPGLEYRASDGNMDLKADVNLTTLDLGRQAPDQVAHQNRPFITGFVTLGVTDMGKSLDVKFDLVKKKLDLISPLTRTASFELHGSTILHLSIDFGTKCNIDPAHTIIQPTWGDHFYADIGLPNLGVKITNFADFHLGLLDLPAPPVTGDYGQFTLSAGLVTFKPDLDFFFGFKIDFVRLLNAILPNPGAHTLAGQLRALIIAGAQLIQDAAGGPVYFELIRIKFNFLNPNFSDPFQQTMYNTLFNGQGIPIPVILGLHVLEDTKGSWIPKVGTPVPCKWGTRFIDIPVIRCPTLNPLDCYTSSVRVEVPKLLPDSFFEVNFPVRPRVRSFGYNTATTNGPHKSWIALDPFDVIPDVAILMAGAIFTDNGSLRPSTWLWPEINCP